MTAMFVDDVTKVYGEGHTAVRALCNASISLSDNEFLALVGPSGSGKTTLLLEIARLLSHRMPGGIGVDLVFFDGEDGGTGAAYNVSMNHMGHPIASNIRDSYLNLVQIGMQNQVPLLAGGGIGKSGNLAANAAALIMLGAAGWYGFKRWKRTPKGKARYDRFVLRVWVVGPLVRMVAISRFARTLGTMLSAGVPLLRTLEIVKTILEDVALR